MPPCMGSGALGCGPASHRLWGSRERRRWRQTHTHRETKKWGRGKSARHRKGTRLMPTGDPSGPFPLHSSLLIPVYPVLAISALLTAQSDLFLELGRMEPQCVLPISCFCTVAQVSCLMSRIMSSCIAQMGYSRLSNLLA